MAGPFARPVVVSSPQQEALEGLIRQHTCPQALALRARIVLGAGRGQRNEPLARQLGCTPQTIRKWRARWAAAESQLAAVETIPADLHALLARVLADAPRPGAPDTFSAEQIVQIINLACHAPDATGRPVTAWTPRELAAEAIKQQIVPTISPRSVERFLKAGPVAAASQPLLAQRQNEG